MRIIVMTALATMLALPAWAQTAATRPAAPAPAPAVLATKPPAAPAMAAPGSRVDVNAATPAQLDALPGIGAARAKAIIDGRPYADLDDLVKKKVLSQTVFDGAKNRMALANINTSAAAEMEKTLPGIGDVRSKAIVSGRPYAGPQDLVGRKILTQAQFDKIKDIVAY